ncbi:Hypothetical_protein [Hexamita inflata]|uniref:Hypothetical_protein n=1 Tax=Hexamita inflata TaxID=28002 RepID=A0AA86NZ45_9EUKA|nr:Hypothetical protein HINF_LOCUS15683 [Hexamita inflata]
MNHRLTYNIGSESGTYSMNPDILQHFFQTHFIQDCYFSPKATNPTIIAPVIPNTTYPHLKVPRVVSIAQFLISLYSCWLSTMKYIFFLLSFCIMNLLFYSHSVQLNIISFLQSEVTIKTATLQLTKTFTQYVYLFSKIINKIK